MNRSSRPAFLARLACAAALVALLVAVPAFPQAAVREPHAASSEKGDFFIIASVDSSKKELLLKFPTEVTELMRVDDKTRYFGNGGEAIKFSDLRAGDTVFIVSSKGQSPVATTIRKGPMTVEELQRRFLQIPH